MDSRGQGGRISNRQRRTRSDLLKAAAMLMQAGKRPSVAEVGDAAQVSRRTAYRYFPTQELLLTETALELLRPTIEASYESTELNPEIRIDALVRTIQRDFETNEDLLRTMIRLTIERRDESGVKAAGPVRGRRRVDWLEAALEPVRSQLTPREFARLISAVSLCVGADALIVLRDVRGLDADSSALVSSWTARALLRAALAESTKKAATRKSPKRGS